MNSLLQMQVDREWSATLFRKKFSIVKVLIQLNHRQTDQPVQYTRVEKDSKNEKLGTNMVMFFVHLVAKDGNRGRSLQSTCFSILQVYKTFYVKNKSLF